MTTGEQLTGTRDEDYNLTSVLYHALQAGETSAQYIADAEEAGDDDLASFFRDVQEDRRRTGARQAAAAAAPELATDSRPPTGGTPS